MNVIESGQIIAKLRKEAGLTQKQLADALHVTDKAVSKWERGICMPDSSLFTKLSILLDADVEYLLSGNAIYGEHRWVGEILIEDIKGEVAGKPLINYLLSYFMLVGITDIYIPSQNRDLIEKLNLKQFGLNISFDRRQNTKAMVIYEPCFLFGPNLTRYFQSFLYSNKNVMPCVDGKVIPIAFTHNPLLSLEWHKEHCEKKLLGRGMIFMPLNEDASLLIKIYEKYSGSKVADLREIAAKRNLI